MGIRTDDAKRFVTLLYDGTEMTVKEIMLKITQMRMTDAEWNGFKSDLWSHSMWTFTMSRYLERQVQCGNLKRRRTRVYTAIGPKYQLDERTLYSFSEAASEAFRRHPNIAVECWQKMQALEMH